VRLEGLGKLKKIHLIGTRTRDLPACSSASTNYATTCPTQEMSIGANRHQEGLNQDVMALVLWLGVSEGPLTRKKYTADPAVGLSAGGD
jgi:hypothetical protein